MKTPFLLNCNLLIFILICFHSESTIKDLCFKHADWMEWSGQLVDVPCHRFVLVVMSLWEDIKEGEFRQMSGTGVKMAISYLEIILFGYLSAFVPRRRLLPLMCLQPPPHCNQQCSCTATIQKRISQLHFISALLRTGPVFTCLSRCNDVSLLVWRSWSMSWPISLKVGLSVGSRLQQRVISSYLGRQEVLQSWTLFGGVGAAWQSLTFGAGQSPAASCGSHPGSSCRT